MSKRLAEGNRVKTRILTGQEAVATGVAEETTVDSYMFQDDVTIIGVELLMTAHVDDTMLNTDGVIRASAEVTRRATMQLDGALCQVGFMGGWTGILSIGATSAEETVMYPIGQGIELDEGESLNLIIRGDWVCTGGSLTLEPVAIVYYVER